MEQWIIEQWLLYGASAAFLVFVVLALLVRKGKLPSYASFGGCVLVIAALLLRLYDTGRAPWATLYETSAILALITGLASAYCYRRKESPALYVPLAVVTLLLLAFSSLSWGSSPSLSNELNSGWLLIHVPVVILAYGMFAIAFAASAALIALRVAKKGTGETYERLDRISYLSIIAGFVLLVLGVILGAIWAKAAWGAYWSWDPKETWSLITAAIYAIYLVARRFGMKGEDAAFVSMLGFIAVLFTYFGVSYLIPGLHSYV